MSATPEDIAVASILFWCDDPDGTDEDLRAIVARAIKDATEVAKVTDKRAAKDIVTTFQPACGVSLDAQQEDWLIAEIENALVSRRAE